MCFLYVWCFLLHISAKIQPSSWSQLCINWYILSGISTSSYGSSISFLACFFSSVVNSCCHNAALQVEIKPRCSASFFCRTFLNSHFPITLHIPTLYLAFERTLREGRAATDRETFWVTNFILPCRVFDQQMHLFIRS